MDDASALVSQINILAFSEESAMTYLMGLLSFGMLFALGMGAALIVTNL